MKRPSVHLVQAFWCGTALASLFLYHLAMGLADGGFYLLWQSRDSLELLVAFIGLAAIFGSAWAALDRLPRGRAQTVALLALVALPLASFAEWLMRLLPDTFQGVLVTGTMAAPLVKVVSVSGVLALAIMAIGFFPAIVARVLERGVLALSPVTLMFVFQLFVGTGLSRSAVEAAEQNPLGTTTPVSTSNGSSIFLFLFDELSYRFLYANGSVRTNLPNFKAFSDGATNYHNALSPGGSTIMSTAGLFIGRPLTKVEGIGEREYEVDGDDRKHPLDFTRADSLFVEARVRGMRTELFGSFLPYCRLLGRTLDACDSFSLWNASTVIDGFSPIAPLMTTFNLWPHRFPYAALSNITLVWQQRRMVEKTTALALGDLSSTQARFRMVHFSIPHIPFVFDGDGYHVRGNPMLQNADNYERQLSYVDSLVGTLVGSLRRAGVFDRSTIVILADHEYRALTEPANYRHVPLMVKRPQQSERTDNTVPVGTEAILRSLLNGGGD